MGCGKIFKAAVGIGLAFATGGASLLASPLAMASLALGTVGTLTGNKFLSMAGMGLSIATGLTKGFGTATSSATDTVADATSGGFIESMKAVDNPFTSGMSPGTGGTVDVASALEQVNGGSDSLLGNSGISNELASGTTEGQQVINDTTAQNVIRDGAEPQGLINDTTASNQIGSNTSPTLTQVDGSSIAYGEGAKTTSVLDASGAVKSIGQWIKENKELVNLGGGLLKGAMSGSDSEKTRKLYQDKLNFEMAQINQQNANANTIVPVGRMVNDKAPNLYYTANPGLYKPA